MNRYLILNKYKIFFILTGMKRFLKPALDYELNNKGY